MVDPVHGDAHDLMRGVQDDAAAPLVLVAEDEDGVVRELRFPEADGGLVLLEGDQWVTALGREGDEVVRRGEFSDVLVALHAHGRALVPRLGADEDDLLGQEGMRRADDGADVERVLRSVDRHAKGVPDAVELGADFVSRHAQRRDLGHRAHHSAPSGAQEPVEEPAADPIGAAGLRRVVVAKVVSSQSAHPSASSARVVDTVMHRFVGEVGAECPGEHVERVGGDRRSQHVEQSQRGRGLPPGRDQAPLVPRASVVMAMDQEDHALPCFTVHRGVKEETVH